MKPSRRTVFRAAGALTTTAGLTIAGAQVAAAYPWSRELRAGTSGADVRELQIRVGGWAADSPRQVFVAIDGDFGPATEAAVRRFQSAYGLAVNGVVGTAMHNTLNSLENADGSTAHFDFSEFHSKDGSGFSGGKVGAATVKENIRVLMYKLEALRRKAGNAPVTINSGFRSVAHNSSVGGAPNSQHMYGIAADTVVSGKTTRQAYVIAETCGFSGLERFTNSWQHVDSRIQYPYGAQSWWWESGIVTSTVAVPGDPRQAPEAWPSC